MCIFSAEGSSGFRQGSASGFQSKVRKCHLCKLKLIRSNVKLKQLAICRRNPHFGNVLQMNLGCALNLHLRMDTPEVFRGIQKQWTLRNTEQWLFWYSQNCWEVPWQVVFWEKRLNIEVSSSRGLTWREIKNNQRPLGCSVLDKQTTPKTDPRTPAPNSSHGEIKSEYSSRWDLLDSEEQIYSNSVWLSLARFIKLKLAPERTIPQIRQLHSFILSRIYSMNLKRKFTCVLETAWGIRDLKETSLTLFLLQHEGPDSYHESCIL